MPIWLHDLAIFSLIAAGICAVIIAADVFFRRSQNMWIMNWVWIITALWSGPLGLYAYYSVGQLSSKRRVQRAKERGEAPPNQKKPFWQSVAIGAFHCGSGCTLADICAEWFVFFVPIVIFGSHIFGAWTIDYVVAFTFGIVFQYFTIKPMKGLSAGEGLRAAVKADTLSLTAWQVGMYGWMAIALFLLFTPETLKPTTPVFWFMMQLGMVAGFLTSYPVNWWLLRQKIKEVM
ncbi:DUF4396 domain-containing protein [Nodosilinea nodulosa]|uniref:DUF4396 domain-containing protein n=1 Tax=Nodosilinea nodulosa TaxID=416001 RepID=UPI00031570B3|nr:DUF4396 domain-containing protein [Nodosilinea nodulosa]